jgi:hypothetical protein
VPIELSMPGWIDGTMMRRFALRDRWTARQAAAGRLLPGWPLRPRAVRVLSSPLWPSMFEQHDAEQLGALVEVRYPFADLDFADFLMNIPAVPWCVDKYISRQAMAGWLPPAVLARPKAPLAGDTVRARLDLGDELPWASAFRPHSRLHRYVAAAAIESMCARGSRAVIVHLDTRALMLNEWLWYHFPRS